MVAVGVLVVMGSGETSPTMVTVHRALAARLDHADPVAVLLDTPYGFQENAGDISARAQRYFAGSVGLQVSVAAGLRGAADAADRDRGLALVRTADWLFSGPGSPSYALRWWRGTPVGQALRDRLRQRRGVSILASAAAATIGRWAVPVYEVYKAGADPHWLEGLDLLDPLGLSVAVIPHYDNTEGGTHDTRYCYLGERRLQAMERELPDHAAVLGVDEHTAALIDPAAGTVTVLGRGTVTVRRNAHSAVLPTGTSITLDQLRDLVAYPGHAPTGASAGTAAMPANAPAAPPTLVELVTTAEKRFDAAHRSRNATAMVQAILDLETAIHAWADDTEEDTGTDQARAVLRSLVVRLGHTATHGLTEPAEHLEPLVQPLLMLRAALRADRAYATADAIRDALHAGGFDIRDHDHGTTWTHTPPR